MKNIKVIFLDMDNTIAENTTPDNIEFYTGLYYDKRPIQIVIDAITTLYPYTPKVILSKAQGGDEGIDEKKQWLSNHFPEYTFIDYIFLNENEQYYMKAVHADQWLQVHNIKPEEALIVDDSKQVLRYCKAYNFQVKYPQQLICDLEAHRKLVLKNDKI